MSIKEFIDKLSLNNFYLTAAGDKLILKATKSDVTEQEIEAVKHNKEVIDFIRANKNELLLYLNDSSSVNEEVLSIYRLSPMQTGMLFHNLYDENGGAYRHQLKCDLINLNVPAFIKSWNFILQRHTILRSSFYYDAFKIPVQCVHKEVSIPITILDFTHLEEIERERAVLEFTKQDFKTGFDFNQAPLMRVALLQLNQSDYTMLWTSHHILYDGWSRAILMDEFLKTYNICANNNSPVVEKVDYYEDFIRFIEKIDKDKEEKYWRLYLEGYNEAKLLPFIIQDKRKTKNVEDFKSSVLTFNSSYTDQVSSFCKKYKITENTLMQGVLASLLHFYTGSKDIVFGNVLSGRPESLDNIENRVGMYINTQPLRSMLKEKSSIIEWLQEIQQDQNKSLNYQYTSLSEIQKWSGVRGDLFDCLMVFQNFPVSQAAINGRQELKVENLSGHENSSNYPLLIRISKSEGINIEFIYKSVVLGKGYVSEIRDSFEHILTQIVYEKTERLEELSYINDTSRQKILYDFNRNILEFPKKETLISLFDKQALISKEKIALVFDGKSISYSQLQESSNRLAAFLQNKEVKIGNLIVLLADRSFEMIIGILGILKAGGAFVPVDPHLPTERINYILEKTNTNIILSTPDHNSFCPARHDVRNYDISVSLLAGNDNIHSPEAARSNDLAYVIFTSGSSGKPKGVLIEHASIVNYILHQTNYFKIGGQERILQFANYSFDASIEQIFLALLNGAVLVLIPDYIRLDGQLFEQFVTGNKVTHLHATPSFLSTLAPGKFDGLKRVIAAGEICRTELALSWLGICDFYNKYGPSESTISVSEFYVPHNGYIDYAGTLPIGKTISNTQLYVLNDNLEPVGIGVPGELYISGIQIARGYLDEKELNAVAFLPNPFMPGQRMYRTGDYVYWLPDGNLVYVKRNDEQIKIRGYRIEPGEIEGVMLESPCIDDCAIVVNEDEYGNKRIVAYAVTNSKYEKAKFHEFLLNSLPDYMIPSFIMEMKSLPLNSNGKVDKKALLNLEKRPAVLTQYIAPEDEVEKKLVAIWQELLLAEKVGVADNFFELGGDSIITIQVVSRARQLNIQLRVDDIFKFQNIREIAGEIKRRMKLGLQDFSESHLLSTQKISYDNYGLNDHVSFDELNYFLDEQNTAGIKRRDIFERCYCLSSLQEGMLFHSIYDDQNGTYRNQFNCDLGAVDIAAFNKSWQYLLDKHTILRSSFHINAFKVPVQCVHKSATVPIIFTDYSDLLTSEQDFLLKKIKDEDYKLGFILTEAPLMRVNLIRLKDDKHHMIWTSHHILHDGWSIPVLMEEFLEAYESYTLGNQVDTPSEDRYEDYIQYLESRDKKAEEFFWKNYLKEFKLTTSLPFIKSSVEKSKGLGSYKEVIIKYDGGQAKEINAYCRINRITKNTFIQGVWAFLLHHYIGKNDIVFGVVGSGRPEELINIERRVGVYINTIPLRSKIGYKIAKNEWLQELQEQQFKARHFQHSSLTDIQRWSGLNGSLFDNIIAFQNFPVSKVLSEHDWRLKVDNIEVHEKANYPLYLMIGAYDNINVHFFYNTSLIEESYILQIKSHFEKVVDQFLNPDSILLEDIILVGDNEKEKLLYKFNNDWKDTSKTTFLDLFNKQVSLSPGNLAIICGHDKITYAELNHKTDQLANFLQNKGLGNEVVLPVYFTPSIEMIIGIIGILKSGCVYVPVGLDYPAERINYILADTEAKYIITNCGPDLKTELASHIEIVDLKANWNYISENFNETPVKSYYPETLAYIIYTSGSTGKPKGVMVEHGSLANYLINIKNLYTDENVDSISFSHLNYTFDASLTAVFLPLICGKGISISKYSSIDAFETDLFKEGFTYDFIKITPSQIPLLFNALLPGNSAAVKRIVLGGEALFSNHINDLIKQYPDIEIFNEYGPTEGTIGCTVFKVDPATIDDKNNVEISIGKPFNNTQIYILDDLGNPVSIGGVGELYIGGIQVARGYVNQSQLTDEKFLMNPFTNGRLYKTGDLARWLPDGNIEYVGRIDDQIKIRGHRVEPGEIEVVLYNAPGVKQAVVKIFTTKEGDCRIGAYLVTHESYDKELSDSYIKSYLPDYMRPAFVTLLKEIPINSHGKIDKSQLSEPNRSELIKNDFILPKSQLEIKLVEIWSELLKIPQIGIQDNFFRLGGDSLLVIRMASAIRKDLNFEISINILFELSTIEELVKYIEINNPDYLKIGDSEVLKL